MQTPIESGTLGIVVALLFAALYVFWDSIVSAYKECDRQDRAHRYATHRADADRRRLYKQYYEEKMNEK